MHREPLRYLRYRAYRLDGDISCGHVLLPSNDLRDSLLKYVVDISVKWRDDAREYFFVTDCDFTYSWLMAPLGAYRSLASVGNLCSLPDEERHGVYCKLGGILLRCRQIADRMRGGRIR